MFTKQLAAVARSFVASLLWMTNSRGWPTMLLGILSDTHGRSDIAERAVTLLLRKADFLIHCGDLGDDVIELLPAGRSAFVFGNNDFDVDALTKIAHACDVRSLGNGGVIELAGKKIAVTHGDRPRLISGYIAAQVDYLLTGHTHIAHDQRSDATRRINPGALHRATKKTVATLDLSNDELQFHIIEETGSTRTR